MVEQFERELTNHAFDPRHCTSADLFTIKSDEGQSEFLAASDEYLKGFVAPVKNDEGKPVCFHCGSVMDSFMQVLGFGAAYEWGIVHGEARCSHCKWPARGMHHPKDAQGEGLWNAQNLFLAYHPDFVEAPAEQVPAQ